jgi:hypothetical protein
LENTTNDQLQFPKTFAEPCAGRIGTSEGKIERKIVL